MIKYNDILKKNKYYWIVINEIEGENSRDSGDEIKLLPVGMINN